LTEPYGVKALSRLYKDWASTGMMANIGAGLVEVGAGSVALAGNMTAEAHGFPAGLGVIVRGGARSRPWPTRLSRRRHSPSPRRARRRRPRT
jgi:hypothetical protein